MGGNGWEGWWRGMVNFWIGDTAAFEGWRTDFWRWHLLSTRGELSDLIASCSGRSLLYLANTNITKDEVDIQKSSFGPLLRMTAPLLRINANT